MVATKLRARPDGRRENMTSKVRPRIALRGLDSVCNGADGRRREAMPTRGSVATRTLLPSAHCQTTNDTTEEAMPDPDAGPSQRPGGRTLGGGMA